MNPAMDRTMVNGRGDSQSGYGNIGNVTKNDNGHFMEVKQIRKIYGA